MRQSGEGNDVRQWYEQRTRIVSFVARRMAQEVDRGLRRTHA